MSADFDQNYKRRQGRKEDCKGRDSDCGVNPKTSWHAQWNVLAKTLAIDEFLIGQKWSGPYLIILLSHCLELSQEMRALI